MIDALPNEICLLLTLAVNAVVLIGAWRFLRRWDDDRLDAAVDTLLLWYLVQYVVIGVLGLVGYISGEAIVAGGLIAGGALLAGGRRREMARRLDGEMLVFGAAALIASYVAAIIWISRYAPAIANDALAYHLPAAAQWLQTGSIGLFHTWFYNPANSYSPLAGSMFIAWLMGPMGNDSLARFVEAPAMLLLFFATVRIARALGASLLVAALAGLAVAGARPFVSQVGLAKDDLPLAAIFLCAVGAMSRKRLEDELGAWRLGAAIGLVLSIKYTAMFSLPVIALAIDAPWRARWRWRRYVIAISGVLVLAGPWFIRNWSVTGDPIYPIGVSALGHGIFAGGLEMVRSDRLRSVRAIGDTLMRSYYSPPPLLCAVAALIWAGALAVSIKRLRREPLLRACVVGPLVVIALFIWKSPYGEVRLVGPALALLGPLAALLPLAWLAAAELAAVSLLSGFTMGRLADLLLPTTVVLAALVFLWLLWRLASVTGRITIGTIAGLALCAWIYVDWHGYRAQCDADAVTFWRAPDVYGSYADAWEYIRDRTPADCTVAYDNFFMVYPLLGPDLSRHVVYVPSRPGLHEVTDLPFMGPVPGEQVPIEAVRVMNERADRATWMKNLAESGARYLLIGKEDLTDTDRRVHPPELDFVAAAPHRFRKLLSNDAVDVYQVVR